MLKKVPDEIRRETLKEICEILDVAYAGRELVMNAIDNKEFKDFETLKILLDIVKCLRLHLMNLLS